MILIIIKKILKINWRRIGISGYKTYLVQLLINNVKIITLNEKSIIDALLDSTGFFTNEEVKSFYFSLICDIFIRNQKLIIFTRFKKREFKSCNY